MAAAPLDPGNTQYWGSLARRDHCRVLGNTITGISVGLSTIIEELSSGEGARGLGRGAHTPGVHTSLGHFCQYDSACARRVSSATRQAQPQSLGHSRCTHTHPPPAAAPHAHTSCARRRPCGEAPGVGRHPLGGDARARGARGAHGHDAAAQPDVGCGPRQHPGHDDGPDPGGDRSFGGGALPGAAPQTCIDMVQSRGSGRSTTSAWAVREREGGVAPSGKRVWRLGRLQQMTRSRLVRRFPYLNAQLRPWKPALHASLQMVIMFLLGAAATLGAVASIYAAVLHLVDSCHRQAHTQQPLRRWAALRRSRFRRWQGRCRACMAFDLRKLRHACACAGWLSLALCLLKLQNPRLGCGQTASSPKTRARGSLPGRGASFRR
jgi:hypothetical protein